ncbi:MAG: type II secretion system F family protein [Myxococcota bacterium]
MSNLFFLGTVAAVFVAVSLIAYVVSSVLEQAAISYRERFTDAAARNTAEMFLFVDPQRLFWMNVVAMVVVPFMIFVVTGDPFATGVTFALFFVLPPYVYRRMRLARLAAFEKQLPDALTMLAGGMRAGASLPIAIQALVQEQPAPLSQEFELFLRQQRVGSDFVAALDEMEKRLPIDDFRMVAAAMRISREVGGNLAETLETLSDTLRRKATMEGKIASLTAQGRMQAIVMASLPILLGIVLNFLEPEAMGKMFTEPVGWAVLSFVVVWEALGFFFIQKVVTIDV